jgi:type I restriction enzyme S subunit
MKLRHLADIRNSNVDKVIAEDELPVRLCNYVDVYKNDFITADLEFNAGSATVDEIERFQVKKGDVIITKDSEDRHDIGIPAFVRETADDIVCGYHLTMLRALEKRTNAAFLFWALQSKVAKEAFAIAANGVTRYGLTQEGIKGLHLWLPDLSAQKRIAAFLDRETARIDALIAKKLAFAELILAREEASFLAAVTGKSLSGKKFNSGVDWIGDLPEGWLAPKFTMVARQETGHTPSRQDPSYWVPEDCVIPWISLADVWQLRSGEKVYLDDTSEKISAFGMANSSARLLPKDTVVLSRTASVGFVAIMGCPMATTQDFAAWICGPTIRPKFLYYVLRAMKPEFRRLMMGSTHQTIYMPDIRSFRTPVPPLDEQDRIIKALDASIGTYRQVHEKVVSSVEKLREFRAALITAAVTGQIDVDTYGKAGTTSATLDRIEKELQE